MILWTYCVDKTRALYKIKFFVFDVRKIDNSYIFLWLFVYFANLSLSSTHASDFLNQDFMTILYTFLSNVIIYFLLPLPLSFDKGVKIFLLVSNFISETKSQIEMEDSYLLCHCERGIKSKFLEWNLASWNYIKSKSTFFIIVCFPFADCVNDKNTVLPA